MENVLRFEHPEYLYWLIVIPVLVILYILIRIRQDRNFKKFADVEMRGYLVPQRSGRRNLFKFVVFLLMLYITNTYIAEDVNREVLTKTKLLEDRHVEYVYNKSEITRLTKQSELAKILKNKGIKESVEPLKKITVKK